MKWWQHIPENIDPNLFTIGSFPIRYYGLMYIVAFSTVYLLVLYRLKNREYNYTKETIQDYSFQAILGVVIGARLGYVLFYDFSYFMSSPLKIILPFDFTNGFHFTGISGMSFHGGLLGYALATVLFCGRNNIKVWNFADLFAPAIPLGYTFGRIGNFINGELYGRVTDVAWGMYFPMDRKQQLRHPSQLYEAFFEGICLFVILWLLRNKRPFNGFTSCLYLVGYGIARFSIEYFRKPDDHLGFVLGPFTMGQLLCLSMILVGFILMPILHAVDKSDT